MATLFTALASLRHEVWCPVHSDASHVQLSSPDAAYWPARDSHYGRPSVVLARHPTLCRDISSVAFQLDAISTPSVTSAHWPAVTKRSSFPQGKQMKESASRASLLLNCLLIGLFGILFGSEDARASVNMYLISPPDITQGSRIHD
jgi:hypothetical protein